MKEHNKEKVTISMQLPKEVYTEFKKYCVDHGKTMSYVLRQAIMGTVENIKKYDKDYPKFDIDDEVINLYSLFNVCSPSLVDGNVEYLSRGYVIEKTKHLVDEYPVTGCPEVLEWAAKFKRNKDG